MFNRKYLDKGKKYSILQNLFINSVSQVNIEAVNKFIDQDTLSLLIYNNKEQLYSLRDNVIDMFKFQDDVVVPYSRYIFFASSDDMQLADIILSNEKTIMDKGLDILNTVCHNSLKDNIFKYEHIKNISKLAELLTTKKTYDQVFAFREPADSEKVYESVSSIRIFINLEKCLFENDLQKLMENLKMLSSDFNRATCDLQFKFVISSDLWGQYQDIFGWAKTAVTEVQVSKRDIRSLIYKNINMDQFMQYLELIKNDRVSSDRETVLLYDDIKRSTVNIEDIIDVYKLIAGVRKFTDEYSESVEDYIYNLFIENKNVPLSRLVDILHEAANQEMIDLKDDKKNLDDDRVISFENLRSALKSVFSFSL